MNIIISLLFIMSHVIHNNQIKKTTNPVISNLEIQIIEHDEILDNSDIYNMIADFHPLVQQEIGLENGEKMKCQIPIFTHKNLQNIQKIVLSQQIGQYLLRNLQNQCCYMTSQFFLWEYCFMKYARQYDDEETMFNGNKNKPENYYLGYDQKYDRKTNHTHYKYNNSHSNLYKLKSIHQIHKSVNPILDNIFIFNPNRMNLNHRHFYRMSLTIDFDKFSHLFSDNDLIDSVNDLNYRLMKYSAKTSNELKFTRKVLFIFQNLIILDHPLPSRLNSRIQLQSDLKADIVFYENNHSYVTDILDIKLSQNQRLELIRNKRITQNIIHNNKVYCTYQDCFYLQKYEVGQFINIIYDNRTKILNTQIIQIVSNDVMVLKNQLKVNSNITMVDMINGINAVDNYRNQYLNGKGSIRMYGSIVFGYSSRFKDQLIKRGSLYFIRIIFNNQVYIYEVDRVFDDNLLIIKHNLYWSIHNNKISYTIVENKKQIFELPQKIDFIHPQLVQKMEQNLKYNIYDEKQVIQFIFNKNQQNQKFNIKLNLYDQNDPQKQIEIYFLNNFEVLIRYMNNKMNYKLSNRKIEQQKKQKYYKIWILIDQQIIRMGIDLEISYQSQLVKFNYDGIQINRMNIDYQQTYNVEIENMKIKQVDREMEVFLNGFDKIDNQQINQQIQNIKHHDLRFIYELKNGTVCDKTNQTRSSKVELKCSQNGQLLEFESINEDEYCSYHIILGTSLLCQDERNGLMNQDEFNKILCRI